jgi:nucleoside 2-deoxyribosyltransferase
MSLTASQRVSLIKEIVKRLSVENYSVIDMTLGEFKLPINDSWSGGTDSYIMQMVKGQDDAKLLGVAKHLGYSIETPSYLEPTFWEEGKLKVFLSHLSKQKSWTTELQEALLPYGVSAFVAHKDIKPTLEWQVQIETALATCDTLVALLHVGFHESNWTDQEIGFAMGRGVPVFSIRFGQDPYGFIGKTQAFQGHGKDVADIAEELFDAYRINKQTQAKMSEVLLNMFVKSGSFAQAKTRIGYLENLETWGADFADRIRDAAELNSQISGSWGVSERVEKLAKKWEE